MTDPNELPEKYQIILLRHGESEGNALGYYQGQADFPLTSTGREQAAALAERWAIEAVQFDRIITSPLQRARATAEIIAARLDAPLELNPTWMEWENGKLAGMSMAEAREKYPRPRFIHPYMHIGESGESITELYLRAGRAVQGLVDLAPGSYLVVAHGGVLNMALKAILGIVPQADFHGASFRFRNTAFARLSYTPASHEWMLEAINDQRHWEGWQNSNFQGDYDRD
jgi:2,3-bisphosphoglycerate-dependent phosphoglycerate mutase